MFGAWGNATLNHETVQLRALDWVRDKIFRISMARIESIRWLWYITLVPRKTVTLG